MHRLFLIAALSLVPAWDGVTAAPVRFEAVLGAESASPGRVATLHLVSQNAADQAISATLTVPGETVVQIPAGSTWQVSVDSPDRWSAPRWIAPSSDGSERLELVRFFPAATVTGALEPQGTAAPPATIDLRLEGSPEARSPKPSLTLLECPVEQARFRCRVPAGRLDLRLRAASFVPSYLWDVEVAAVRAAKGEGESEWLQARLQEDRDSAELRLVLQGRMTIQVQVLSDRGPIPGAHVQARGELGAGRAASGDEAVSGASGELALKLPAGTRRLSLSVLAPGYATRMMTVALGAEPVLQITLEPVGGTVVLDFGDLTRQDVLRLGAGLLFHGGTFVPLGETARWSQMQRAPQPDAHRLVLPNMAPGEYLLCVGGVGPRGEEPPAHQCSRGALNPLQDLVLAMPAIPARYLERLKPSPRLH